MPHTRMCLKGKNYLGEVRYTDVPTYAALPLRETDPPKTELVPWNAGRTNAPAAREHNLVLDLRSNKKKKKSAKRNNKNSGRTNRTGQRNRKT